ncbi:MAG: tetratricopeptide repeat protein [Myxococcota bacterium]
MPGPTLLFVFTLLSTPEQAYALLEDVPSLVEAGAVTDAREKAEEALGLDPENFEALSIAAALAERAGDLSRALELQERILEIDPNADEARLASARLLLALGRRDDARVRNEALLDRHPQSEEGLALRKAIVIGEVVTSDAPAEEAPLQALVRFDTVTGYDSNPTLANQDATGGAANARGVEEDVAILNLDGSIGFYVKGKNRPLTVLARVNTTRAFDDSDTVANALASTFGVSAIGRQELGENLLGTLDLRYQALFVDGFNDFFQHFAAPSALVTYQAGAHQLRALAGVELRFFDGIAGLDGVGTQGDPTPNDSITPRLALRDTIDLGRGTVILDVGARLGVDLDEDTALGSRFVGSQELSSLVFGQYELFEDFTAFGGTDVRWRAFDTFTNADGVDVDARETVVQLFAGVRYEISIYELHAEYGYSTALAGNLREFDRQQVTGGVRVWYY